MKKLLFFLLMACTMVSCSDNEQTTTADAAPLLQKVIFNANSSNENQRHWDFNENGKLAQIANGDGTVLYTFDYDGNGRVSHSTRRNANGTLSDFNFTYNPDGSVATLNGTALQFDAGLGAFYFGDLNTSYRMFKLDSNGLLTYNKSGFVETENGIPYPFTVSQAYVTYAENNLKGQSFHNGTFAGFEHDSHINPLREATIAAFRAYAVTDYNEEWLNSFAVSANNVNRKNYPSEYYIHEEYVYQFNAQGFPVSATMNFYDHNQLDFSAVKTLYYYQGI